MRVRSLTDEFCRNVKGCQVNEKVAALPISFQKASYTKEASYEKNTSGVHKHFWMNKRWNLHSSNSILHLASGSRGGRPSLRWFKLFQHIRDFGIQVNNHEIVVKFFHISHNLTWYSEIVQRFTRISKFCSTYELTKQFMEICVKNCAIDLKKNNL